MHYAISDIHGCYNLFTALLEKISFSDADTLFFLGDAADRGPDGIAVLQALMRQPNIICLLGNHEEMFWRAAWGQNRDMTRAERRSYARAFYHWTERNGGEVTWNAYCRLPEASRAELLTWMEGLPTFYELSLGGRTFLLAHAGVGAYQPEKPLTACDRNDFIWERMDYDRVYYQNKLLVSGHTPTLLLDRTCVGKIVQRNHHIAIDCGACFTGTLGCICLETLQTFYVSSAP